MRTSLFLLLLMAGIILFALSAEAFIFEANEFLGGTSITPAGRLRSTTERGYFNPELSERVNPSQPLASPSTANSSIFNAAAEETNPAENFDVAAFAYQIDTDIKETQWRAIQESKRNKNTIIENYRKELTTRLNTTVETFRPPPIIINNLPHGCEGCAFVHGVVKENPNP